MERALVARPFGAAEEGNLLGVKGQGFDFADPDGLFHLLCQLFERIAVTANDAVGNLHLGAEFLVVGADLQTGRSFIHIDRIALLNIQSRQGLLGEDDSGRVADGDDFGCGGDVKPPGWVQYNISYNIEI